MPRGIYPRKNPTPYMKTQLAKLERKKAKPKKTKVAKGSKLKLARSKTKKTKKRSYTLGKVVGTDNKGRKVRRITPDTAMADASAVLSHLEISHDLKVNPPHYVGTSGQEVIDVLEDFNMVDNMYRGQAIQYMFRAGRKDTENVVADLLKAIWFIEREITHLGQRAQVDAIGRDRSHDVRMAV